MFFSWRDKHVNWTWSSRWRKLIKDVWWSVWVWVGEFFFWYWPTWAVQDKGPLNGCVLSLSKCEWIHFCVIFTSFDIEQYKRHNTHSQPFVRDYPGRPVPEETFTHSHPSWSPDILYQLPASTMIQNILPVQFTRLTFLFHNLSSVPLWSSSWSRTLYFIFHTFLQPIIIFFSQHMSILSQPVLL